MSARRGFILQPTYELRRGRPVVQLFGRLEEGDPFLVEDDRFRPYFHAAPRAEERLRDSSDARVSRSAARDFAGRPVVRVEVEVPGRVPELRDKLRAEGIEVFEADVRFAYLYLIDRGVRASIEIEGESARLDNGLLHFVNPELRPSDFHPSLRVLALDIETSPDTRRVYSVSLYGSGADEVHVVAEGVVEGARHHASEALLLWTLQERIRTLDPDVLTGWNVVDFDLRVLAARAQELGVQFRLGRSDRPLRFQNDPGFTRQSRVEVAGRQVLDGIALVRDASIKLDDYRLETAAQHLLGRGKLIDEDAPDPVAEIDRMYREDPAALAAYNREDSKLVIDILERESLVELAVERSLLTGMQLDRVGASIASFDLVYLPELRRRGRVAPSVDSERKSARLRGGAVLDSHPGFFRNVGVFDFKSLYPSLMRTFNLDPLACADGSHEEDALVAPNGARFSRREAILPGVLESFGRQRDAAKRRGDKHADFAIKILMNSFYGVLGAGSCRFFNPDVANAITGFGQQILAWTQEAFEKEGVQVLYGDTDSVFVAVDPEGDLASARARADALLQTVQRRVSERVSVEYAVEPRLELELERIYERLFQPTVRGGTQGSKKRYAGLVDGKVRVVGLEAVRRDWPQVARRLQLGMLEHVFHDRDPVPFLREVVAGVRDGSLDRELVIRKGLRKGSVDKYTSRVPPHVEAARRSGDPNLRVVRYVVTRGGPEPVVPGRPFPRDPDTGHYLEKVLRPVAVAILEPLGTSWEEALDLPRQLSLL
ncbi:MAG: DNA polymerase II [Deltaproteobacteria bacterium]|nr:DNA polymerase II [Deltaproteobacteria bacterium]MBW2415555.1 DNA polymerase II [Deltaproteobacteria bacterium]